MARGAERLRCLRFSDRSLTPNAAMPADIRALTCGETRSAISTAASSCIAGIASEEVSGVIESVGCLSRSLTTLRLFPARGAAVVWTCAGRAAGGFERVSALRRTPSRTVCGLRLTVRCSTSSRSTTPATAPVGMKARRSEAGAPLTKPGLPQILTCFRSRRADMLLTLVDTFPCVC